MQTKVEFHLGIKLDNGSYEDLKFETEAARQEFIEAAHHVPEIIAYHPFEKPTPNSFENKFTLN